MDNNEKLKQLLDAGVITSEEYNNKINNIEINMQLKDLLEAGVITQEEYDSKIDSQNPINEGKILGKRAARREEQKHNNINSDARFKESQQAVMLEDNKNSKGTNVSLIVLGILVAFAVGIGIGVACCDKGYDVDEETFYEYESAYYALYDFYLDDAVLVREGDGTYYHRYGCSTFPDEYTFWCYNVDAAKQQGYLPCPTCFGEDKDEYIKSNL